MHNIGNVGLENFGWKETVRLLEHDCPGELHSSIFLFVI